MFRETSSRKPQRWQTRVPCVAFSLLLVHSPSLAQSQQLTVGEEIRFKDTRLSPDAPWTDATVDRVTSDTLWLANKGSVHPISINSVEMQRNTHPAWRWKGLVLGVLAGAALGARVGRQTYYSCSGAFVGNCVSYGGDVIGDQGSDKTAMMRDAAILVGVGGGFLGYYLGKRFEKWETFELDQLTVGNGSLALSLSIRR